MVFPEVNCPGDHAEVGRWVRDRGGIVPSAGTSNNAGYREVGGRHSGVSVVVGGDFKHGWCHTKFRIQCLGI